MLVAKRFAPLMNADGYLETDDMLTLIQALRSKNILLVDRILVHDLKHPRSIGDRVRLLQRWIAMNNPEGPIELSYDKKDRRVRLSGPVKKLNFRFNLGTEKGFYGNFLKSLDPLDLDLHGTQIVLRELRGLQPLKIDIRGTPVANLSLLSEFRSLTTLIVEQGQFSKTKLSKVPSWTKVVVLAKETDQREE